MKKMLINAVCMLLYLTSTAQYSCLREIPPSSIRPKGWIREYLTRQQKGLTGNRMIQGFPFTSNLWQGVIPNRDNSWWPYEQSGYYLDGSYKLGLLLGDSTMIRLFKDNLNWVVGHPDAKGQLGPSLRKNSSIWPNAVFFKAFIPYYLETHDRKSLDAFHKFYSEAIDVQTLGVGERHATNIEGVLKIYEWTKDKALLDKAVKAYELFNRQPAPFSLPFDYLKSGKKVVIHGVTYSEELKLPVILYIYTGNKRYLDAAENAIATLERDHLGFSGVPSSNEYLATKDPLQSHETCVSSDLTWTLGYFLMATGKAKYADMIEKIAFNAAPGAISKHFENLQYFSSDNQFICTSRSNHNKYFTGNEWMQFSPSAEPACCPGNVHRMMPNYASRMWMADNNGGITAALYGPSVYEGSGFSISEKTDYPFSGKIIFEISASGQKFPFTIRIPGWCKQAQLSINGTPYTGKLESETFVTLDRNWNEGDKVELTLPMDVKLNRYQNVLSIERGPVLYSYAIPERVEVDKKTVNALFPTLNLYPAGDWNYALDVNENNYRSKVKVIPPGNNGYPFDNGAGTPRLEVPVRKIKGWALTGEGRYTPPIPIAYDLDEQVEWITLVPYGATRLRLTQFPEAVSRENLPVGHWEIAETSYKYDRKNDILSQKYQPETSPAKVKWIPVTPDKAGLVDLTQKLDKSQGLAYVRATVTADRSGSAILAVNSKDAAAVWVNGKLVHTISGPNCVSYQMPDLVKVNLKKGRNQVMLKVGSDINPYQYPDGWGVKLQCVR